MGLHLKISVLLIGSILSGYSYSLPYLYISSFPQPNIVETYWWPSAYQKGDRYFYTWPLNGDLRLRGTTWVDAINGDAPSNAVIYQSPKTTQLLYYCRVQTRDQTAYGQLVPDQGCEIGNTLYSSYQVLVR